MPGVGTMSVLLADFMTDETGQCPLCGALANDFYCPNCGTEMGEDGCYQPDEDPNDNGEYENGAAWRTPC